MTIGPEPRTRMERRSDRLGMAGRKCTRDVNPWGTGTLFADLLQRISPKLRQTRKDLSMNPANLERLHTLLKGHEDLLEEKRSRPEGVLRPNDPFREQFNHVARSVIV